MSWNWRGTSHLPHGEVVVEQDDESKIFRASLVTTVADSASSAAMARSRLADKLEAIAKDLRR